MGFVDYGITSLLDEELESVELLTDNFNYGRASVTIFPSKLSFGRSILPKFPVLLLLLLKASNFYFSSIYYNNIIVC